MNMQYVYKTVQRNKSSSSITITNFEDQAQYSLEDRG